MRWKPFGRTCSRKRRINGTPVPARPVHREVEARLTTERFAKGRWEKPTLATRVHLVAVREGEAPLIYEMGIPVCEVEWSEPYHCDVQQRCPMNPNRDAVMSGYPARLHRACLPALLPEMTTERALAAWVGEAAQSAGDAVQKAMVVKAFGAGVVRAVPATGRFDHNADAEELGSTVVHSAHMTGGFRKLLQQQVPTAAAVAKEAMRRRAEVAALDLAADQPDASDNREVLWNEVEACGRQRNACLAREVEFALPAELLPYQAAALARDYVLVAFVSEGMAADLNVHWALQPDRGGRPISAKTYVSVLHACVDGPSGARGLLLDLASGATAVMCPAFDAARWPLAQMGSANETTTKSRPRPAIARMCGRPLGCKGSAAGFGERCDGGHVSGLPPGRNADAADTQAEADVLGHRHVREQSVVLEHHADVALPYRHVVHHLVPDAHSPFVRLLEPGDGPEHRRLAAAAGTEQAHELGGFDADRDVLDRDDVAEPLGQARHAQRDRLVLRLGHGGIQPLQHQPLRLRWICAWIAVKLVAM